MTDLTPPALLPRTVTTPLPPTVGADTRPVAGLDRVRREVLAGSTGRRVETRADEVVALGLLLSAASQGDEDARTTVTTLGQLPRAWPELRARVPRSPSLRLPRVETPGSDTAQPLAVTRPRSRVSAGQPPAGVTA